MTTVPVRLPAELPLRHEAEVLVAGGGPGGIGAAVAAAREGRDVLLVEHYGFLGGMATAGEVNPFMPNHANGQSLDQGIFEEWLDRMGRYGGRVEGTRIFDPYAARLAAEDLCLEAGVRILYHHRAAHAEVADRRIETLVLHSKSGLTAARAAVYVDSTGDGDLCALAGCPFDYGEEGHGQAQPMTLCFKLKLDTEVLRALGVEGSSALSLVRSRFSEEIEAAYQRAKADGRLQCPRENVLMFGSVEPDVVHFNTTRILRKAATDGVELSEAEIEGRRQFRQLVEVLRRDVPLFRNSRIHSIAPQIGVRESRRIRGRARITRADFGRASTFPDGITRVNRPIDIHSPTGSGTEIVRLPKTAWYEIPYGCLIPETLDNVLVGSRCISADHAIHASLRVMPPVCSIGQAAGTAAAMALEAGTGTGQVDGVALKARLIAQGRNLARDGEVPVLDDSPEAKARRRRQAAAEARSFSA